LSSSAQGITSIIISHKLNEVRRIADRITVLRDGATVSTLTANSGRDDRDRIIKDMVGRDMAHRFPERKSDPGEMLMEVRDWNVFHPLHHRAAGSSACKFECAQRAKWWASPGSWGLAGPSWQ
jgi:putative multiple sugar transport system ATP-binding protein